MSNDSELFNDCSGENCTFCQWRKDHEIIAGSFRLGESNSLQSFSIFSCFPLFNTLEIACLMLFCKLLLHLWKSDLFRSCVHQFERQKALWQQSLSQMISIVTLESCLFHEIGYNADNPNRCFVRLYKCYDDKCPLGRPASAFYLTSLCKPKANVW